MMLQYISDDERRMMMLIDNYKDDVKLVVYSSLEFINLEEAVSGTVRNDEILVNVDRDALWNVDVVRHDLHEVARDATAVHRSVLHDPTVAFVGDQQVELAVEAETPRLVELALAAAALAKLADEVSVLLVDVDAVSVGVRHVPESVFVECHVDRVEQATLLRRPELPDALPRSEVVHRDPLRRAVGDDEQAPVVVELASHRLLEYLIAKTVRLLEMPVAIMIRVDAEEADPPIPRVCNDDSRMRFVGRRDSARVEELVLAVALRSVRFEAAFVSDVVKELDAMVVSFGDYDVTRLGVDEIRIVTECPSISRSAPFVVEQRLVWLSQHRKVWIAVEQFEFVFFIHILR